MDPNILELRKKYGIPEQGFSPVEEKPVKAIQNSIAEFDSMFGAPDKTSGSGIREAVNKRANRMNEISEMDFTEGGQYDVTPAYEATAKGARQIANFAGGVADVARATPIVGDVIEGTEKSVGWLAKKGFEQAKKTQAGKALAFTAEKILEQIPEGQKYEVEQKIHDIMSMPNVQEATEALGDLTDAIGIVGGAIGAPKLIRQGVQGAKSAVSESIDAVRASRLAKNTADIDKLVGSVVQGKPADISKAKKALQSIDIEGVETYDDLRNRFDEKIEDISTKLDEALSTKTDKKPLQELNMRLKVGSSEVSHNYVEDALNQLDELYTKTNDPVGAEEVRQLRLKAESDGLTVKEINDIARMHGNELGTKAFSKTGDPLTSVNAQSFENTRTGIKNTARELFGDDVFKAADAEMSNLIRSRDLAEKMTVEVNKLRQRIQERGMLEKIGRGAFEVFDLLTGKFASGFLRSALVPRGGGLKTLNALDLEKNLAKTLAKIKSVPVDGSVEDITKALEKIAKDQSNLSIQDLTPGNTLSTKSNAITPQSANRNVIPETIPNIKKKSIVDNNVVDTLSLEAKKYKSAEEFVKGKVNKEEYGLAESIMNDSNVEEAKKFYKPLFDKLNSNSDMVFKREAVARSGDFKRNEMYPLSAILGENAPKQYKKLADEGYRVAFGGSDVGGQVLGVADKQRKLIQINTNITGDDLTKTLAHEIEHILQEKGNPVFTKQNMYSKNNMIGSDGLFMYSEYTNNPLERVANSNTEKRIGGTKYKGIEEFLSEYSKTKSQLEQIWKEANSK